jgi:hypothetical protein
MRRVCLVGLLGFLLLAARSSFGDDQAKTEKNAQAQKHTTNKPVAPPIAKVSETKATPKSQGPGHSGQLNFALEQKEIKAVMDKYSDQINQLETQLRELKSKRDAEIHAVWNEARQKMMAEAKANSEKYNRLLEQQVKQRAAQQEKAKEGNAKKVAPKENTKGQSQSHPSP